MAVRPKISRRAAVSPEAGGLIIEHHIVAMGNAHEVIASGGGEQGGQVFDVILVRLHVVGVTGVAAHGNAGEFPP